MGGDRAARPDFRHAGRLGAGRLTTGRYLSGVGPRQAFESVKANEVHSPGMRFAPV